MNIDVYVSVVMMSRSQSMISMGKDQVQLNVILLKGKGEILQILPTE